MKDKMQRSAYVGHMLADEMMRRHQAGHPGSARSLERSVLALIAAKPSDGFKKFFTEEQRTKDYLT